MLFADVKLFFGKDVRVGKPTVFHSAHLHHLCMLKLKTRNLRGRGFKRVLLNLSCRSCAQNVTLASLEKNFILGFHLNFLHFHNAREAATKHVVDFASALLRTRSLLDQNVLFIEQSGFSGDGRASRFICLVPHKLKPFNHYLALLRCQTRRVVVLERDSFASSCGD